jgi:hypothetical protein
MLIGRPLLTTATAVLGLAPDTEPDTKLVDVGRDVDEDQALRVDPAVLRAPTADPPLFAVLGLRLERQATGQEHRGAGSPPAAAVDGLTARSPWPAAGRSVRPASAAPVRQVVTAIR